jgi:methionyl-tRNA synthetase
MEDNTTINKYISFEDYTKVEVKVGLIKEAVRIKKSKKLIKMMVWFGGDDMRQIVTNIGEDYHPLNLTNVKTAFVTNFEPITIMGEESKGMLFATTNQAGYTELLRFSEAVDLGTKIG